MRHIVFIMAALTLFAAGNAHALKLLGTYNGNSYYVTEKLSWHDADAQAQQKGGYLVAINDSDEQQWLNDQLDDIDIFWTGLTDRVTEGVFQWTSGEIFDWSYWWTDGNMSEPSDIMGAEDYVVMNWYIGSQDPNQGLGMWNDIMGCLPTYGVIEVPGALPTPLPATLILFAPGIAWLARRYRRA